MEIWNHFVIIKAMHPLTTKYILDNNIPCDEFDKDRFSVDVSENNPHWGEIERLLKLEDLSYFSETKFDKNELLSAEWLTVRSRWYYDYPQPEDKYREITYTKEFFCSNRDCWIGLVQKDKFRFKRTPKWGKRNFCMINWVYDELFVSPKAKELLEASSLEGFSFMEVYKKSGTEPLADVFQLIIPYILQKGMIESTSKIRQIYDCPVCGGRKFLARGRGRHSFKKEIFIDAPDFVKSAEIFGAGGTAAREILVSQRAYRFIVENKLDSSLVFEPITLV